MNKKYFGVIFTLLIPSLIIVNVSAQKDNNSDSSILEKLTFDTNNISIDSLTKLIVSIEEDFIQGTSFYDLVGFAIGMVVYGVFIFHFYQFLSKRDMFNLKLSRRLSSGKNITKIASVFAFIVTNFLFYPIIIFVWFIIYSLFMFFLAQELESSTVFLIASSIVIGVRIAAYYKEDLAKDLAKLLPFAMLGFFILSPKFFTVDDIVSRLNQFPAFIENIAIFLIFAIIVETFLSVSCLVKQKIKPSSQRKIEDHIEDVVEQKVKEQIKKIDEKYTELNKEIEKKQEELDKMLKKYTK